MGSRTQLSLWETFTIEKHPKEGVAIKTHWNKYWKFYNGGEGKKIDCLPDVPKEWEQIDIVKVDGKYAFQSLQHTPANGNPTETLSGPGLTAIVKCRHTGRTGRRSR